MPFDINRFHSRNMPLGSDTRMPQVPLVLCADGFTMSVQASAFHYCIPRDTFAWPYEMFEVGFPNRPEPLLRPYAEDPYDLTGTVYGYVPAEIVNAVVKAHGGLSDYAPYPAE